MYRRNQSSNPSISRGEGTRALSHCFGNRSPSLRLRRLVSGGCLTWSLSGSMLIAAASTARHQHDKTHTSVQVHMTRTQRSLGDGNKLFNSSMVGEISCRFTRCTLALLLSCDGRFCVGGVPMLSRRAPVGKHSISEAYCLRAGGWIWNVGLMRHLHTQAHTRRVESGTCQPSPLPLSL
jgi:hypothetical protein